MSPVWILAAVAMGVTSAAQPQAGEEEIRARSPEDAIERYLDRLGLGSLLAVQLHERLETADGDERDRIAARLADLYATELSTTVDPEDAQRLVRLSEDLIRIVPGASSGELRVNLAKARFLAAEAIASRALLARATGDERQRAVQIFTEVVDQLEPIAEESAREVLRLERREESRRPEDMSELRGKLLDARRQRSISNFYIGWSRYHLAALTGADAPARAAIRNFAALLNAVDETPSVGRVPRSLLRYDHVGGAALGVALSYAALGQHATAMNWLELLTGADNLGPAVERQLFAQRAVILAAGGRFDDLRRLANLRRGVSSESPRAQGRGTPLPVAEARLLAVLVLSLEGDRRDGPASALLDAALDDLVESGHVAHLVDLAERFGTFPLDERSFAGLYVRGIREFDQAVAAERSGATPADQYRRAASLLRGAVNSEDAERFPDERARASVRLGTALLRSGETRAAGEAFEAAADRAPSADAREEALWLAVAAYDRAALDGDDEIKARRDAIAALYLQEHPGTERAARLALSLPELAGNSVGSVETLESITRDSPLYDAAQRRLAALLYRRTKSAGPETYSDHAASFIAVARRLVERDRERLSSPNVQESRAAARNLATTALHTIDVVVNSPSPDIALAREALADLAALETHLGTAAPEVVGDLDDIVLFERVRIAAARGDGGFEDLLAELRSAAPARAAAADRYLFRLGERRLAAAGADDPARQDHLRLVVYSGVRILDRAGGPQTALEDPTLAYVQDSAARAAAELWEMSGDQAMLERAYSLDLPLREAGGAGRGALRRLARTAEAIGDERTALSAWRSLLGDAKAGTDEWYRARYHSIRVLAAIDPAAARAAFDQFETLAPELGGPAWADRFRDLERDLPAEAS